MKTRVYVGVNGAKREVFRNVGTPTERTHGERYAYVIGPFRTARGAQYMRDYGIQNPLCQSVYDAETLAKRLPGASCA